MDDSENAALLQCSDDDAERVESTPLFNYQEENNDATVQKEL